MFAIARHRFLAIVAAAALTAACQSKPHVGPDQPATTLTVVNTNFLDMTVYVLRGSQRVRLGIASSNRKTTFEIPASLVFGPTALSFLADPIGSDRRPTSQEITVSPGDNVQ